MGSHRPGRGPKDADCLRLGLKGWHPRRVGGMAGTAAWTRAGRPLLTLAWQMRPDPGGWAMSWPDLGQTVPMRLETTLKRGSRWWWSCPSCGRQAGALWLPPTRRGFACRSCWNVRYASRLRVHPRRMLQRLAGVADRLEKRYG